MVGQGVLRECLLAPDVEQVLAVGRTPTGQSHAKLKELAPKDLFELTPHEDALRGFDACFFCPRRLGGRDDRGGLPTADLRADARAGTGGKAMWARVKGETEAALLELPFRSAFMFRPGLIQPQHGAVSKTRSYRILYAVLTPLLPLLRGLFPSFVTTNERMGKAMLRVAREGASAKVLENRDINALAR
jgi:uncharacterized protein YbjT (DUF2867 family)